MEEQEKIKRRNQNAKSRAFLAFAISSLSALASLCHLITGLWILFLEAYIEDGDGELSLRSRVEVTFLYQYGARLKAPAP
jgi:hypothetical protein